LKQYITVLPLHHEGKTYALLKFRYHPALFRRLSMLSYVRFSKTYRRFVTHLNETRIRMLVNDLAPQVRIQLDQKIEIRNLNLLKLLWEQAYMGSDYISCPDAYLEKMRLKNYSLNTMRTYHAFLMKFFNSHSTNLDIINSFTEKEINQYHRGMIQSKKYSFSTINQSLNAVKYYYNEILAKDLTVDQLERPQKRNPLPKVLQNDENRQYKAVLSGLIPTKPSFRRPIGQIQLYC
jgi:integrase/recombinase XerD